MKFSIINLGCKVNDFEAESIASVLVGKGWERDDVAPDAVLIFTCAVTNTAASKSRKMLNRTKRKFPEAVCAVIGCYVQIDDGMLDEADILIGTAEKEKLPAYLEQFMQEHQKIRAVKDLTGIPFADLPASVVDTKARCELKIQDGCNQFCTYCIIPYARGRERSLDPDTAVKQAVMLAEKYHEIVLTGIHTGRYGREYGVTLAELIRRILDATRDTRLRISSIEITEITEELIDLFENESRLARFLHIPLQSGSDTVLARMHRPYTTAQYYEKLSYIRSRLGNISVSTDVIVGFPKESEEEYRETYDFLKKCEFSFLHVFPYSPRNRTMAADMSGQIDTAVKKQRAAMCIALSQELEDLYRSKFTGLYSDMICEWVRDGCTTGHTSEYIPVRIQEELVHGDKVDIQLLEYKDHIMIARKVSKSTNEAD